MRLLAVLLLAGAVAEAGPKPVVRIAPAPARIATAPTLAPLRPIGGLLPAALPRPAVQSIDHRDGRYWIDGKPARELGFGSFKTVLLHPGDPTVVVKIFRDISSRHLSLDEKRIEQANIHVLSPSGAAPGLLGEGATTLRGKTAGYILQERVAGSDLQEADPAKLAHVRRLFAKLADAGVEISDAGILSKLRQNIMVGTTRSSPETRAYLVDVDFTASRRGRKELEIFYEGLLAALAKPL